MSKNNTYTLNEYQQDAKSTRMTSCDNITYLTMGMFAEAGEVADKIAKWVRKREAYVSNAYLVFGTSNPEKVYERRRELLKEVGDVLWFVACLADHLGFTLQEVAEMNIEKLQERKANGTIISHTDH